MNAKNGAYTEYDLEAAKILDDFLPEKIFDAHMHHPHQKARTNPDDLAQYKADFHPLMGDRDIRVNMLGSPEAGMVDPQTGLPNDVFQNSVNIIKDQLTRHPEICGATLVCPADTVEDIEKRIAYIGCPNLTGLKVYHGLSVARKDTFQCEIGEYLPESAWEVANARHMTITLHMVKDKALADPANLAYIRDRAGRFPDAKLILAHCARSFAAWTAIENVDKVTGFDNVFFDFSAVCESPQMFMILKKAGIDKCMWGSDWTVSRLAGKCISIADSFYWIGEKDLARMAGETEFHSRLVGTENLMAVRQAFQMLELTRADAEKFFYKNAERIFLHK